MNEFDQILTSLNLCASDTREDALKSVIRSSLYGESRPITLKELNDKIKLAFGIELYNPEFKSILEILTDCKEIDKQNGGFVLNENSIKSFHEIELLTKEKEKDRFNNFKIFLNQKWQPEISELDTEILWRVFLHYLYQCFFYYGEMTSSYLNLKRSGQGIQKLNNTEILYSVLSDFQRLDLADALKLVVDNFSDFAQKEDIEFVDSLGQKALSFSSLGLNPDLADIGFEKELINWVLFLDTNFLFSILDLHVNMEDEACKELLKLLTNNPNYIKVKLYYSDLTLKELKGKKVDFRLIDDNLTNPAIRALLRSDELDEFSRRYYQDRLDDPENVLHPSKIVDLADITLRNKQIEVFSTGPQRKFLGEEYLDIKVAEYQRYINDINQNRREFYQKKPYGRPPRETFRSDSQKEHDMTLREIISLLRISVKNKDAFRSMNKAKYFGLTLDELLIRFDSFEIRKKGLDDYPTFFRPSYLLNKLIKILPVKTDNYKKAFIKAVSSRGFSSDARKSSDIIKLVRYLKDQGIDNEEILLNLITEKVFLETFREESHKDEFNQKEFVEAEMNKVYAQKIRELEETKKAILDLKAENQNNLLEKKRLNTIKDEKEEEVHIYSLAVQKLNQRLNTLEGRIERSSLKASEINFDAEELAMELQRQKDDNVVLRNEILKPKRKKFVRKKILKWRLFAVGALMITLIPGLVYLYQLYSISKPASGSFLESIKENQTLKLILGIVVLVINVITGKLVYDRFFNESFIKIFRENIEFPNDLNS